MPSPLPKALLLLLGAILLLVGLWAMGKLGTIRSRDLNQHRLDTAAPLPNGEQIIRQRFIVQHNGFDEVELMFARFGDESLREQETGRLTLTLHDEVGNLIAREEVATSQIKHNQSYALRFAPQWQSADRPYTLTVTGTTDNTISLWGYSLNPLPSGQYQQTVGQPTVQALRLITRYQLGFGHALMWFTQQLSADLPLFILFTLILFLPYALFPYTHPDAGVRFGIAIAIGLSAWPLAWLWLTILRGRWTTESLWVVLIIGWSIALWRRRNQSWSLPSLSKNAHLFLLFAITLLTRLLAVRQLAAPPWADGVRHGVITAVMVESGRFLQGYGDYLPITSTPLYHFGYHALAATLILLGKLSLPQTLLITGQLLQTLLPFTAYAGIVLITRRRLAGWVAAFLIALPLFFPGYYLSWGRLTQLTAMTVMPILLALTWQLAQSPPHPKDRPNLLITALCAAGLFLIHFRVFLLYIPFAVVVWLWHKGRGTRSLALCALLAIVAALPRLWSMSQWAKPQIVFQPIEGYNAFPFGYLTIAWEKSFLFVALGIAVAQLWQLARDYRPIRQLLFFALFSFFIMGEWSGLVSQLWQQPYLRPLLTLPLLFFLRRATHRLTPLWVTLLSFLVATIWLNEPMQWLIFLAVAAPTAIIAHAQPRLAWQPFPFALIAWWSLLLLLLSGQQLGLPETWVINLNSTYITFFLSLAWFVGCGSVLLWDWLGERAWLGQLVGYVALGGLLGYVGWFGVRQQINILNDTTALASSADFTAMAWIDQNLPPDAKIANSAWLWLGGTWAGSDGGSWITTMTKRRLTTPPADYEYNAQLYQDVGAFNKSAEKMTDWAAPAATQLLRQAGVTHLYVGVRGGWLKPEQLAKNPDLTLLYQQDGTFLFAVTPLTTP